MTCHVLIRQTLDWAHASHASLLNAFVQKVACQWDRTFEVSFTDCRARIKEAAHTCHSRLTDAMIHESYVLDAERLRSNDIILICDDDDVYHPWIVERLKLHLRDRELLHSQILVWPDGVYGCTKVKRPPGQVRERKLTDGRNIVKTNNYAMTGALIHREPHLLTTMRRHGGADEYVRSCSTNVTEVSEQLSLVNRHPCSQLVLQGNLRGLDSADFEGVLKHLVRSYVSDDHHGRIQPTFEWASQYISQTKAVFRESLGTC